MGRAGRKHGTGGASLRGADPLQETSRSNGYLDLQSYAQYGIPSEYLSMYAGSEISEEDQKLAREAVDMVEDCIGSQLRENQKDIYEADFSDRGLEAAEKIFTDLADGVENEDTISESMDPDRQFLFQSDSDHLLALADYMAALRTRACAEGRAESVTEAHMDRVLAHADALRSAQKDLQVS